MYQYVCSECKGRSFSAAKLSTLRNPECPYCEDSIRLRNHVPDTKDAKYANKKKASSKRKGLFLGGKYGRLYRKYVLL